VTVAKQITMKYFSLVEGMKLCLTMTQDNAKPKVLSMVILQLTNVEVEFILIVLLLDLVY